MATTAQSPGRRPSRLIWRIEVRCLKFGSTVPVGRPEQGLEEGVGVGGAGGLQHRPVGGQPVAPVGAQAALPQALDRVQEVCKEAASSGERNTRAPSTPHLVHRAPCRGQPLPVQYSHMPARRSDSIGAKQQLQRSLGLILWAAFMNRRYVSFMPGRGFTASHRSPYKHMHRSFTPSALCTWTLAGLDPSAVIKKAPRCRASRQWPAALTAASGSFRMSKMTRRREYGSLLISLTTLIHLCRVTRHASPGCRAGTPAYGVGQRETRLTSNTLAA